MFAKLFKKRNPKSLFINPKFQISLIGKALIIGFFNLAISLTAVEVTFNQFRAQGVAMNLPAGSYYFKFVESQHWTLFLVILAVGLVSLFTVLVWGMVLSHRIAGPLHRLKTHALDVSQGKTEQDVAFRRKDYFLDVAEAYNKIMESYRKLGERKRAG